MIAQMGFVERIFGWSPDDGSGVFELMLFAIPIFGIAYLVFRHRCRRHDDHE